MWSFVSLGVVWSALAAQPAEAPSPYRWTVSVDPLTTAIGIVHLQVERALGAHASVYVGPSLRLFDGVLAGTNGPWTALGAEAGGRWFFVGDAPRGGWVMLRGVLAATHTDTPTDVSAVGGYTSALVGYTGVLGPGLVLSGGVGVSYFDYGAGAYGVHGLAPAAHTAIGWAFR